MKKMMLLLAITITTMLNAQIEFPDGYDALADSMVNANPGEKTFCNDGMIYKFSEGYTPDDLSSILKECDEFLKSNEIDFHSHDRSKATTYVSLSTSMVHASYIDLMDGYYVYYSWYLKDDDGQKYRAFLLLDDEGIEFSIDDKQWIDK